MADRITIADLEVMARIGVPDAERVRPQRLQITVEMETDVTAAAAADDLARTINYYAVSRRVLELAASREWRLIETLAVALANLVLAEFGSTKVGVEVRKFILPEARHVAVRIERARS